MGSPDVRVGAAAAAFDRSARRRRPRSREEVRKRVDSGTLGVCSNQPQRSSDARPDCRTAPAFVAAAVGRQGQVRGRRARWRGTGPRGGRTRPTAVFALRPEVVRLRPAEAGPLTPPRLRGIGSPSRSHAVPRRVRSLRSRRRASQLGGARVAVHAAVRGADRLAGPALRQARDQHVAAHRLADGRHGPGARRGAAPRADLLDEGDSDRHRRVVLPLGVSVTERAPIRRADCRPGRSRRPQANRWIRRGSAASLRARGRVAGGAAFRGADSQGQHYLTLVSDLDTGRILWS